MEPNRGAGATTRSVRGRLVSGKGSSSPYRARGVGIAALQIALRIYKVNKMHRNESAEAGNRESDALSSLLTARTGRGGLTEALT